jgi:hypothetical protein
LLLEGRDERLEGYQTWSAEVEAMPGSTLKLHHHMLPGPSGPEYGPQFSPESGDEQRPGEEPDPYAAPRLYEAEPERN